MAKKTQRRTPLNIYRTYNFIDKDPAIDKIRTIVNDEGLIKKLNIVHELSGVATTTLDNWFNGETKCPQNRTLAAVASALGYELQYEKTKDINVERELVVAKKWREKMEAARKEAERRQNRAPGRGDQRVRA